MKSEAIKSALVLFCMVFFGCSVDEDPLGNGGCRIDTIASEEFVFDFKYNAGGNLFFINQEFLLGNPEPFFLNLYVKPIGQDSIVIGRLLNNVSFESPTLTAKYENEKVVKAIRFIPFLPAKSTMAFTYETDKIRITIDYEDGLTMQLTRTYGDYFLDVDGNVIRIEKYTVDEEGGGATLFEETDFTYDTANNPWRGQVYPLLFCTDLPNPKFFSPNNVLSKIVDSETVNYSYGYDADNTTISGDTSLFNSCTTDTIESKESYSYLDCGE